MANTFVKIQTVTVGAAGAATIDFTSIPQTYTDLQIVLSSRGSSANVQNLLISFNGSTLNLSNRYLLGNGSTVSSGTQTNGQIGIVAGTGVTASVFNSTRIYIPNYTSSNNKSFTSDDVSENNATEAYQTMWANLWSNTAAITSVSLSINSGNFVQYSTATLYGIKSS